MSAPSAPLTLPAIALNRSERGLVLGGSGSGKSTLAEALVRQFSRAYTKGRVLVLDSKPRFRAEWEPSGFSARRRYRGWDHGAYVPGSMAVNDPDELDHAWRMDCRVAIAQGSGARADIVRLINVAERFYGQSRASRPQLIYVDETLDFFTPGAAPAQGTPDTLLKFVRAGRERGSAALFASQRAKGIPAQVISELTKLYLFRLDFGGDIDRLFECGVPKTIRPPEDDWQFLYWTKTSRRTIAGPYRLAVPQAATA